MSLKVSSFDLLAVPASGAGVPVVIPTIAITTKTITVTTKKTLT